MSANEVGTTNLDAKLISNLGQAFEINELLKEDQFVLPQFNIATSSQSSKGRNKVMIVWYKNRNYTYAYINIFVENFPLPIWK